MNYCFAVPVRPGGEKAMKEWARHEIPSKGHDEVFRAAGIRREQVWLQPSPMGELAIVSFEVDDPAKAIRALATSTHPWAARFRAFLLEAHGVDFAHPPPPNAQVVDWVAHAMATA